MLAGLMFSSTSWLVIAGYALLGGQPPQPDAQSGDSQTARSKTNGPALPDPMGLKKLSEKYDVWIDPVRKMVVVDGEIAIREGPLEMFACPKGSKDHESIVAVNSDAMHVHAGLLAIGAVPGSPVSFDPKYTPAKGPIIDVFVLWKDKNGKRRSGRAQQWIKQAKTGKEMPYHWVFAGSQSSVDESTGKSYYAADYGDMICVSNFSTAMLDIPVESSQANSGLLFTPFTERIPPRGSKVRLVLALRKPEAKTGKPMSKKAPGK